MEVFKFKKRLSQQPLFKLTFEFLVHGGGGFAAIAHS